MTIQNILKSGLKILDMQLDYPIAYRVRVGVEQIINLYGPRKVT